MQSAWGGNGQVGQEGQAFWLAGSRPALRESRRREPYAAEGEELAH
jgi:hypothetical protein